MDLDINSIDLSENIDTIHNPSKANPATFLPVSRSTFFFSLSLLSVLFLSFAPSLSSTLSPVSLSPFFLSLFRFFSPVRLRFLLSIATFSLAPPSEPRSLLTVFFSLMPCSLLPLSSPLLPFSRSPCLPLCCFRLCGLSSCSHVLCCLALELLDALYLLSAAPLFLSLSIPLYLS